MEGRKHIPAAPLTPSLTPSLTPHPQQISHNLHLKSAYSSLLGEEPKHTNFTVGYVGVLDYIWYSAMHLRPLTVAPVPEEAELTATGDALPNSQYPSDHLILFSDMQFGSGPPGTGLPGVGSLGGQVLGEVRKGVPPGPGGGLGHLGGGGGTPQKQMPGQQAPVGMQRKDARGVNR